MNIIFAGTPEFAAWHLQALLDDSNNNIIAVLTQPDRKSGRGQQTSYSAVKQLALDHDLPVHQPTKLSEPDIIEQLTTLNADIMVVVAYGLLLPESVLNIPKFGCINVHASVLPKWRGAAPIQYAILNQDKTTGISIMQMQKGLDDGPVFAQSMIDISPTTTAGELTQQLAEIGKPLLVQTLEAISNQTAKATPQDHHHATHAGKIKKQEAEINWQLPAKQLVAQINAYNPWPMSFFQINQQPIRVLQAIAIEQSENHPPGTIIATSKAGIDVATGDGLLRLITIQLPGKKAQSLTTLINGLPNYLKTGKQL